MKKKSEKLQHVNTGIGPVDVILNKKVEETVAKREDADRKFLEEYGPTVLAKAEADFKALVESDIGCAVIIAGSDSDYKRCVEPITSHMEYIIDSLNRYHIPFEARVCSAHKQPEKALELLRNYNSYQGSIVIVAVAGTTDALSGLLSYHSLHPVISCPPDGLNTSSLSNPSGSSNAFIRNPSNLGKYVAQMFSTKNPRAKKVLEEEVKEKIKALELADCTYRVIHYGKQDFLKGYLQTSSSDKEGD